MQSSDKQRASHIDDRYCSTQKVIVSLVLILFKGQCSDTNQGHTFHNKSWQTNTNSHGFVPIDSATYVISRAIAKHRSHIYAISTYCYLRLDPISTLSQQFPFKR